MPKIELLREMQSTASTKSVSDTKRTSVKRSMDKKKAAVKNKDNKSNVSRTKKTPMQKTTVTYVRGPGAIERTLMCLATILRSLLKFIERKIQTIKTRRLAEKMDDGGNDLI